VSGDEARRAAYLTAYELFEAVQSEAHAEALARIPLARERARRRDWPEVDLVLAGAAVVHDVCRPPSGDPLPPAAVGPLVEQAEAARLPALLALALGLRGLAAAAIGDTRGLMSDTSRAIALLDDEHQPPLDRCTGLVVAAGVFNTLRLWELVDELYGRAADLGPSCDVPAMAAAIGVNRVLTRVEWAVALLENGDAHQCLLRLQQARDAVPDALAQALPPLWRRDVEALGFVAGLLSGTPITDVAAELAAVRASLDEDGDIEVLPLLDAAVAWSLWRSGSTGAAVDVANRLAPEHLELMVSVPAALLPRVRHAGAIFVGAHTPEVVGDYVAGPNHVLPTAGTARFASPLGTEDFVKRSSVIEYSRSGLAAAQPHLVALAAVEGLDGHGRAAQCRAKEARG
jgi:hypothetical protein